MCADGRAARDPFVALFKIIIVYFSVKINSARGQQLGSLDGEDGLEAVPDYRDRYEAPDHDH